MMKNRIIFFFILVLVGCCIVGCCIVGCCSAQVYSPLSEKWSYNLKSDELYTIDADKDGLLELYAVSYSNRAGCISFFDYDGTYVRRNCISGYGKLKYPHAREEINFMYLDDINHDGVLDVLAASSIIGGSVNVKKLYIIHREYVAGLKRYEYDFKWDYTPGNIITDIKLVDIDGDEWTDIIASSLDSNVYVLGQDRKLKYSYDLGGGVWSIFASDIDADGRIEIIAGAYSGIFLLEDEKITWNYSVGERIIEVYASDLNEDNLSEILALSANMVYLLDVNGSRLWMKPIDNLVDSWIADVDNDGNMDILLLTKDSLCSLDAEGNMRWQYGFDEQPLTLTIDLYNNIFVGSADKLYRLAVDQDYFLNKRAEESYLLAYNLYLNGDYDEARVYATRAKQMFLMVNNTDGTFKCDFIFLVTKLNSSTVDKRGEADKYYAEAVRLLDLGSFDEARDYAEMSLHIYLEINDRNSAIKCDLLRANIDKKSIDSKVNKASWHYTNALDSLSSLMFDGASAHAQDALVIYTELNDSSGIMKSKSLLSTIALTKKRHDANLFCNISFQLFDSEEYDNASIHAEKAIDLYVELADGEKAIGCGRLFNLSVKYVEAESYYDLAMDNYRSSNLDNASFYVLEAKALYGELNNSKRVDSCDFLLTEIEKAKIGVFIDYAIYATPIVFFLLLILFLNRRRRLRKQGL